MKLIPKYSYEFNCILNPDLSESENIKNFASLLSDKDRFLSMLGKIEENSKYIEEKMGFKFPDKVEFYIVRAEKFKSFSEPITIEYSILPEEMIVFLLKEIVKTYTLIRFNDEITREIYINSFVDHLIINADWGELDFVKFSRNLHEDSQKNFQGYEFNELDFSNKTLKEYIEDLYNE